MCHTCRNPSGIKLPHRLHPSLVNIAHEESMEEWGPLAEGARQLGDTLCPLDGKSVVGVIGAIIGGLSCGRLVSPVAVA